MLYLYPVIFDACRDGTPTLFKAAVAVSLNWKKHKPSNFATTVILWNLCLKLSCQNELKFQAIFI